MSPRKLGLRSRALAALVEDQVQFLAQPYMAQNHLQVHSSRGSDTPF